MEETYTKAMEMLKKGSSKEEVLLHFEKYKEQLSPLLDISAALLVMPKNSAPEPAMQRKYAFAPSKNFWLNWIHISKFAGVSMSVMLLVSLITATGYAAWHSSPGGALFSVKKSAEQVQVLLAQNDQAKANIQVAIAQQRLSEAQEIFSNPTSGPQQKAAALTELSAQTSTAVAQVNTAAQTSPEPSTSQPLLNSLQALSTQQRSLLSQIKPDTQIDQAASSALASLDAASQKITQIKELVAIADSGQTLAKLSANPSSVVVLGQINKIDPTHITVEKTAFDITPQTTIQDAIGDTIKLSDLTLKTKVNIVGTQDKNSLIAEQILVTSDTTASSTASSTAVSLPEVKGDSTTTSSSSQSTAKKPETSTKTPVDEDNSSINSDTSTGTGLFIIEDPAPQYIK